MTALDHKIPPLVIMLLCAVLAWVLARSAPGVSVVLPVRTLIVVLLLVAGVLLAVAGVRAFRKADTTVDPRSPDQSRSIVRSGPFGFTRNPMYLGMVLVLFGFCAYLANPMALIGVVVFAAYITRFQIIPEERLLLAKFGEPFAQYMRSVRRWI